MFDRPCIRRPPPFFRTLLRGLGLFPLLAAAHAAPAGFPAYGDRPFDDGWRFLRGNSPGAEQPAFDDSAWRTVNLPHDWSIENLPPRDKDPLFATVDLVPGLWSFSPGDNQACVGANFQDADWEKVSFPAQPNPVTNQAFGWYRRHFTIPAGCAEKTVLLNLGIIHDPEWTYVDGAKVHESGDGYWSNDAIASRLIQLPPADAAPGDHVIAVRVRESGSRNIFAGPLAAPAEPSPLDPGRGLGGISTGYAVGGTGWYRKHFALSPADAGKQVRIVFDGSYMETSVWLNGVSLGHNYYGYSPFSFDLTPYLKPAGQENVLSVEVENPGANSRWYSGSGLYRPVHLEFAGAVRLAPWGLAISTSSATPEKAAVRVSVTLAAPARDASVELRLFDPDGAEVARAGAAPAGDGRCDIPLVIARPRLWSPGTPALYRAEATVRAGGAVADVRSSIFGVRTLAWNAAQGFLLNGSPIKLRGGCIHHDLGPLGAASFPQAEERRVAILKAAGYNAIRCSHNMPSTAFLDACDRLGMLVIDEAFDMWTVPKNPMDYARFFKQCSKRDIEAMVERDRDHPSVIMWSIGNEIPERFDASGAATARRLADLIHALDPTRPVTAAFNDASAKADPFFACLDICGYNYAPQCFEPDHARVPGRIMFTTESFPKDSFAYWSTVRKHPYVIGDFVWTAWDYRGESGIGHTVPDGQKSSYLMPWPYMDAFCGDFDECGFVKPQGLYRQVLWGARPAAIVADDLPPGAHSRPDLWGWRDELPSWNWPGTEGQPRAVRVYARGDRARLLLDGRELATEPIDSQDTASFIVPYRPGTLTAQILTGHRTVAEEHLSTAGLPAALKVSLYRGTLPARSDSVAFVTVEAVDANGVPCPQASDLVTASISGPGLLAGFGNGDPCNDRSVQTTRQQLWRGKALLVVRSTGSKGESAVRLSASGLANAETRILFE